MSHTKNFIIEIAFIFRLACNSSVNKNVFYILGMSQVQVKKLISGRLYFFLYRRNNSDIHICIPDITVMEMKKKKL